ncbi:MAG: HAMP domain-containing histidine kinase [Actinobacteria bacterium]|nr:HAMP domain-containing histidine kinase [Actinomycetota bacterium]
MNFRRAYIKLTLGYMLLIMLVCGFLSYGIYRGGAAPLERRLERGEHIFQREPPPDEFMRRLEPQAVEEVKHRVAMSLIYFNIAVLCLAGLLSYFLAKRELRPMEEALELQGRFTSDASHELRTPLTAMKTEIEVALRSSDLKAEAARELLESNLEEIGKLEALSSGLLKLAQYEEGVKKDTVGTIQLKAVIEDAVERVKHSAAARGIKVDLQLEESTVLGDRGSLLEMLVILLDNSVKYSDDNTTVAVSSYRGRRHVLIRVKDEGYGISESDLAHVFDRFYRGKVPASKEQVTGYGLGLSIAKGIAELNHGSIEIESVLGEGTTATVRLPLSHEKRQARSSQG